MKFVVNFTMNFLNKD